MNVATVSPAFLVWPLNKHCWTVAVGFGLWCFAISMTISSKLLPVGCAVRGLQCSLIILYVALPRAVIRIALFLSATVILSLAVKYCLIHST